MSITQAIREKYAKISVIAIALALLGFILMDALSSRTNLFGSSTTIGSVNGEEIDVQDFSRELELIQRNQQGNDEASTQQAIENLWNYKVNRILLEEQFEELGIFVGSKEMGEMLYGANPSQYVVQYFGDPQTGQYDPQRTAQIINQIRSNNNKEARAQLTQILDAIEYDRMTQKYVSLLSNSIHVPKWFAEKQIAENSLIADISYVAVDYTTVPDSSVRVSDDEIRAYIEENEEEYELKQDSRSISYIAFSAAPTSEDSTAIFNELEQLKPEFQSTDDPMVFVQRNGSVFEYHDGFVAGSAIQIPVKDSIFALPQGGVFGPYLDPNPQGGNSAYVLAKKVEEKMLPDSARVRHILVQVQGAATGGQGLPDSLAKQRIDSIERAIAQGANFDTLAKKLSDDGGSKNNGGVYDYFPQGKMVKAFNDFSFEGSVGDKKVVQTEFGYHYVEILGQKGRQPYYKIAYMARPIVASANTDQSVQNEAIQFAGNSSNSEEFDANWEKNLRTRNINKQVATNIAPNAYNIPGIGISRNLVRSIYEADKGDVLQPEKVGDNYIVATVTEVNEKGETSLAMARPMVEPILRNKKKAEQIIAKLGSYTSLEAAASAVGQQIRELDSLTFNNSQLGFNYKVIGAAFNPANKGKLIDKPIEDQSGVYVVRVNSTGTRPVENADPEAFRMQLQSEAKRNLQQMIMYGGNSPDVPTPVNVLRKAASIKDNRSKFY